jgi:hypothetical protein
MQQSSKQTPCPACGRGVDGDCRFSDQVVLCHVGRRFAPPQHLRIGDQISIHGRPWALVATGKGYDGAAHVFKPHRENSRHRPRPQKRAVQVIDDLHNLERCVDVLDSLAGTALEIPPLEQLLDEDITKARDICEEAFSTSQKLLALLSRISRVQPSYEPLLAEVRMTQRDLRFQLADLNRYVDCPAKYWEIFLLQGAS